MLKMAKIKFSHKRYTKLAIQTECARLLQVFIADYSELSKEFIEYDTSYWDEEVKFYELPKTKLLILLFQDEDNGYLFTTVRRWTPRKEEYYRSLQGEILDVVLPSK
jgi:hypothetical protein